MRFLVKQLFLAIFSAIWVLCPLSVAPGQTIPPSYGFLEVVDFEDKPVEGATVNPGGIRTNAQGLMDKGVALRPVQNPWSSFSILKAGYYRVVEDPGER